MDKRLEIFIITYNRQKYLKETLLSLLNDSSPLKKCDITIINNNSTDETDNLCSEYEAQYKNIHYVKNNYNIGWSDITQAFFLSKKEYVWVLADDDYYDFSHINELEEAMNRGDDVICCCHHVINTPERKADLSNIFIQLSLLPAGIYRRTIIDNTCMKNMHENNYTMFPHMILPVTAFNKNLKTTVLEHEILKIGIHLEETDCSYNRGTDNKFIFPRNKNMNWICGFANICSGLHNRNLAEKIMRKAILEDYVYGSINNFVKSVVNQYSDIQDYNKLVDIYINVDSYLKIRLLLQFIWEHFLDIFFKIKKDENYRYIRILFIKFKTKRKKKY